MTFDRQLSAADLAGAFGIADADFASQTLEILKRCDFRYRRPAATERDTIVLEILRRIDERGFAVVGEHRSGNWDAAWGDALKRYEEGGRTIAALDPVFIGGASRVRLFGDYACVADPRFEFSVFRVFRDWLFRRYLGPFGRVLEFGCGSGFNLAALSAAFPDKALVGLDWAPSAVALVNAAAKDHGLPLQGRRFDFFHPDDTLDLNADTAVLTFCALEQVGDRFAPFLDYLLAKRPGLCIHMEPTPELYDPDTLPDYLALRFHRHRKYLTGLLPALQTLADDGRITLHTVRRLGVGSLFHEGYTVMVWSPA